MKRKIKNGKNPRDRRADAHGGDMLGEQLRYLFEGDPKRRWALGEIGEILGFFGKSEKFLKARLDGMVRDGEVEQLKGGFYIKGSKAAAGEFEGRLDIARSGAGFVTDAANGRTLKIAPADARSAMPGDIVRVRPVKVGNDGEGGRIVAIVKRSTKLLCATLAKIGGDFYAIPLNPAYAGDIAIDDATAAHDGDRVVVRITDRNGKVARGEIVDVIGPADKPSLDTEAIVREYELPGEFPPSVIAEAECVDALQDDVAAEREDLRKRYIITIDPAESRDFDDAISFVRHADGTRELGVHIADVAHYVRPGSELDKEAFKRGNSVYLADKVIPMLPEVLSNGVCSLRPRVERKCFSVFMKFDPEGRPLGRRFTKSVIKSNLRLNYHQALAIIEGREPEGLARTPKAARELLQDANALAQQLRANRMKLGALDLDLPECHLQIDADGRMTGFVLEEYDASHQLIEECMVAANEAVATELAMHGVKIVSRLHEPPDPLKLSDLGTSLKALGFRPGDISNPANLSRFIASISNHPLRTQAHTLILRSMRRAMYSAEGHGHFGLAKVWYSHFTSPIRRYSDLVLHRQLGDYILHKKQTVSATQLASVAAQCTDMELRADEAERTLLEIKKFRFLQAQVESGDVETYDAVISKVTPFGLFVDIPLLAIGGLVHISTLSRQFVRYSGLGDALVAGRQRWALGDKVKVAIAKVDFHGRRLDFTLR